MFLPCLGARLSKGERYMERAWTEFVKWQSVKSSNNINGGMSAQVVNVMLFNGRHHTVGNSSVSVRFVSTKLANGSFLFDFMGQWELLI